MSEGVALGIDLGTSGLRVALLDRQGRGIGFAAVRFADRRDPQDWWSAVPTVVGELGASQDLAGLQSLAVDGTSGTLLAIDAAGDPLGPVAMYDDPAPANAVGAVAAAAPPGSAARGATSPLAKALGLQRRPGVARLLHQADWIAGRLLGSYRWSDANNALKTGYDPVAQAWPDWLAATGLRRELLPEVCPPGSILGPLDAGVADQLALPRCVQVVAGTTDGCAAFLAAGATRPGEGVTSLGSTLVLKLAVADPIAAPDCGVYSHRLDGFWLASGASNSGGAALARHFNSADLARLSARIDPTHASPLDYYPLPGIGERFPVSDPDLASRVTPRPADDVAFLHGLLEGIARIEAAGYRRLADLGAPPLSAVRSLGGGARNAAWIAIRARVLGVPMLPAVSEDAAVGAAILALRATRHGGC